MRCALCSELSVELLIDLARTDFSAHSFPSSSTAFYQHHASFADLARAAAGGCHLCGLIADCFKGIRWDREASYDFTQESWEGSACDLEESAFAAARDLDVSDVKLAINTTQLYLGGALDEVRVLNTLLVQVGFSDPVDDDGPEATFPTLTLILSTTPEEAVTFGPFRVGRFHTDPDLGSARNFAIARSWLAECRTHDACFTNGPRKLPTRVVDIGPPESLTTHTTPMRPRVHLSGGAESDYIALSHCWGGRIPTLLTSQTYDAYLACIPYEELPANFQDALSIARELSIRYVWIDSLCIIQDSKSDWEEESKKMAAIYRDSTLTVSALVSPRSTAGILKVYDGQHGASKPKPASLPLFRDKKRREEVRVEWRPFWEENFRRLDTEGALNKRGWCFQEFILSPSNLLFGNRQIYWKCSSCSRSADGMPEGNEFPDTKYPEASRVIYSGIQAAAQQQRKAHEGGEGKEKLAVFPETTALLRDYYTLVQDYSCRSLTFGSDKLPAFSGVATSLHPALGGVYLAGIWTADFHRGLLWMADIGSAAHIGGKYRAPSWSWMVTDEPIIYQYDRLSRSKDDNLYLDLDLELLEHEIALDDKTNPYGPISSSRIVVRGRTISLLRSKQPMKDKFSFDLVLGTAHYDEPSTVEASNGGRGYLHEVNIKDHGQVLASLAGTAGNEGIGLDTDMIFDEDTLILLVQAGVDEGRGGETAAHGLVLRGLEVHDAAAEATTVYERIGMVVFETPKPESFKAWECQTLVLI